MRRVDASVAPLPWDARKLSCSASGWGGASLYLTPHWVNAEAQRQLEPVSWLPPVGVSFFGVAACCGPPLSAMPSPPLPPAACVTVFHVICVLFQVVDGQVVTVAADVRVATAMQHCHLVATAAVRAAADTHGVQLVNDVAGDDFVTQWSVPVLSVLAAPIASGDGVVNSVLVFYSARHEQVIPLASSPHPPSHFLRLFKFVAHARRRTCCRAAAPRVLRVTCDCARGCVRWRGGVVLWCCGTRRRRVPLERLQIEVRGCFEAGWLTVSPVVARTPFVLVTSRRGHWSAQWSVARA